MNQELKTLKLQQCSGGDPSPTPLASLPPAHGGGRVLAQQAELQLDKGAISSAVAMVIEAPGVGTERRWMALSGAR